MPRDIVPISGREWNQTGPAKHESRRILAGSARMTPDRESMDFGSIPRLPPEISSDFRRKLDT
jgi:hypothetical protein